MIRTLITTCGIVLISTIGHAQTPQDHPKVSASSPRLNYDHHLTQSSALRTTFWEGIGQVHADVLSHLVNPAFVGAASWPSLTQAYLKVDTNEGSTIICTDGLSDPYSDFDTNETVRTFNGIGFELFVETDQPFKDLEKLKDSWELKLLYQASQTLIDGGANIDWFAKYTYLSLELFNCDVPHPFEGDQGEVGVILGLESTRVPGTLELSIEKIRLIQVTVLHTDELEYIRQHGAPGRIEIAKKITSQPASSLSGLQRASVIQ